MNAGTVVIRAGWISPVVFALVAQVGLARQASPRTITVPIVVSNGGFGAAVQVSADDLTVLDEGRARRISSLRSMAAAPLTVGFVFDGSGSMRDWMESGAKSMGPALASVLRPEDRFFVVRSAERLTLIVEPTSDTARLRTAFDGIPAEGATRLFDNLQELLERFEEVEGRRAVVLVTDGDDTGSRLRFEDLVRRIESSGVIVHAMGVGIPHSAPQTRAPLGKLAAASGGRTFSITAAPDLDGAFAAIRQDWDQLYLLSFEIDPEPPPGKRHKLRVESRVESQVIQAPRGYTP